MVLNGCACVCVPDEARGFSVDLEGQYCVDCGGSYLPQVPVALDSFLDAEWSCLTLWARVSTSACSGTSAPRMYRAV
jgi:hypothetical protein